MTSDREKIVEKHKSNYNDKNLMVNILVYTPSLPLNLSIISSLKPWYCLQVASSRNCMSQVDAVGRVVPCMCEKTRVGFNSSPRGSTRLAPEKTTRQLEY